MQLDEWMTANGVRGTDLAKEWGLPASTSVSQIKTGARRPTFDNLVRVHVTTGGKVSLVDFIELHRESLEAEGVIPKGWKAT